MSENTHQAHVHMKAWKCNIYDGPKVMLFTQMLSSENLIHECAWVSAQVSMCVRDYYNHLKVDLLNFTTKHV